MQTLRFVVVTEVVDVVCSLVLAKWVVVIATELVNNVLGNDDVALAVVVRAGVAGTTHKITPISKHLANTSNA